MNEPLKQIAIKAQVEHCISHVRLQEFAELIVKECAKVAYKYTSDSENYEFYADIGWDCLPNDLQSQIKEHFGIEE